MQIKKHRVLWMTRKQFNLRFWYMSYENLCGKLDPNNAQKKVAPEINQEKILKKLVTEN
jgi:hypothetical protein